jgi:N-acetylmuramoyl-L-alanine amidase
MALLNFTGSPHGGSHKLLLEWDSQPKITPVLILDHTLVGTALGSWWYFYDGTGLESHFIIRGRQSGSQDGHIWQLMDTGREAHANYHANNKAISIETEDNGARPIEPWSRAQVESLIWLHDKLVQIHPTIKRVEATDCDGPGLGYHSKLGAPSCWTPAVGKDCPGPARISQWRSILLPAFLHPSEEDDMPTPQEVEDAVFAALQRFVTPGGVIPGQDHWTDFGRVLADREAKILAAQQDTNAKLDELIALLTPPAQP